MAALSVATSEYSGATVATTIRRTVNDEVARTARQFDASEGSRFEFVCESGSLACRGIVPLTLAEYDASEPGSVVGH